MSKGYVAFDLDGTLAVREKGDSIFKIGAPISNNVALMKDLLAKKVKVKILTARGVKQYPMIAKWLKKQGIEGVEITNKKCSQMSLLVDDRAVGLIRNDGLSHMDLLDEAANIFECIFPDGSYHEQAWMERYKKAKKQYKEQLEAW